MSATAALAQLRAAGVTVEAEGAQLRLRCPTTIAPALLTLAKTEKAGLLRLVADTPAPPSISAIVAQWPADIREQFIERAAIIQFDGGETMERAERMAFECYRPFR